MLYSIKPPRIVDTSPEKVIFIRSQLLESQQSLYFNNAVQMRKTDKIVDTYVLCSQNLCEIKSVQFSVLNNDSTLWAHFSLNKFTTRSFSPGVLRGGPG